MKVLISAYACRPHHGSEQGVGWEWVRNIARFHMLWVLTSATNQPAIERESISNANFIFLSVDKLLWLKKLGLVGRYVYYYIWHYQAYKKALDISKTIKFDIIHQLTFGTFRIPAFISKLQIPFIWGPVGGGEYIPVKFWHVLGHHALGEFLRTVSNPLFLWIPGIRASLRRARKILVVNEATLNFFPKKYQSKSKVLPIVGDYTIEPDPDASSVHAHEPPIKLLFVGKLEPRRGLKLMLGALVELLDKVDFHFRIIGDGPERKRYERLCKKYGLSDRVTFVGRIPYELVYKEYAQADIFCSSSLRDSGGSAYIGAMASGLPIICIDHAGPGELVTGDCGIKVPLISRKQVVEDLATAIEDLARDAKEIKKMGEAGIMRVRKYFDWEVKTKLLMDYYEEVGAGRN